MVCPVCHYVGEPSATVEQVSVCANCGMSLVVDGDDWRKATYTDVSGFTSGELEHLRKASGAITRAGQRLR